MAFSRRSKFRKRNRKSYRKKGKRSFARKRKTVKRVAARVVSRAAEIKQVQAYAFRKNVYPSTSPNFGGANVFPVGLTNATYSVSQGVGASNRVGNRITTKRLIMRGSFSPAAYDSGTNPNPKPQLVKMVFFLDRSDPNAVPVVTSNFFQMQNVNGPFLDDVVDMWRPINTDRYRIFTTKTFKVGNALYDGGGASTSSQLFANNDFRLCPRFRFDLTRFYPKNVKFDETNVDPTTRNLYCLVYIAAADGSLNNSGGIPILMSYTLEYDYTDM